MRGGGDYLVLKTREISKKVNGIGIGHEGFS